MSTGDQEYRSWYHDLRYILHPNVFVSSPPSTEPYAVKTQVIATRIYVVLLSCALTILFIYTSAITNTRTITVKEPSPDKYIDLYTKHGSQLSCPCKNIALTYSHFLTVNYTLHQVCSSTFITQEWINYERKTIGEMRLFHYDYRSRSSYIFQALNMFCQLAREKFKTA